jgi:hypothetical protein
MSDTEHCECENCQWATGYMDFNAALGDPASHEEALERLEDLKRRAERLRGAVGALREIRERMDKEPDDEMLDDILAIVDGVLYPLAGGR